MKEPFGLRNKHLDGSPFFLEGDETAILCVHGYTATTVEVRSIANFFHEHGYTVSAPLLPGHGTTPEDLNQRKWTEWVDVVEQALLELIGRYTHVFILGESMGALISLYMCEKYREIKGAMLFAPANKIRNLVFARFLWPIKPYLKKAPPDPNVPQQSYGIFPLKAAASLYQLQKIVRKNLHHITTPTIIFQGFNDRTIDQSGSVLIMEEIFSKYKEIVWLTESGHVILLDKQLPLVQEICLEFIAANSEQHPRD